MDEPGNEFIVDENRQAGYYDVRQDSYVGHDVNCEDTEESQTTRSDYDATYDESYDSEYDETRNNDDSSTSRSSTSESSSTSVSISGHHLPAKQLRHKLRRLERRGRRHDDDEEEDSDKQRRGSVADSGYARLLAVIQAIEWTRGGTCPLPPLEMS